MARRRGTRLAAPYLRTIRIDDPEAPLPKDYPYFLPWLDGNFELAFDAPVTIQLSHCEIAQVEFRSTDHFRLWRAFATDPDGFVAVVMDGNVETLI